jgi:hypothetical protein
VNPYLSKIDVLGHYVLVDTLDPSGIWELQFHEGGKVIRVFDYYSWNEAQNFWEDDALMHWMKILKRTWDDEDFKEAPDAA